MTKIRHPRWQRFLRSTALLAAAVALAIAVMVDYCLSAPARFALHLAAALVVALCLRHPRLPRACRMLVRDLALMLAPACAIVVCHANITAVWASRGRIFADVRQLPHTKVGLVFGTTDRVQGGRQNLYFRYRIDAAATVWNAGRIDTLIVSGDNRSRYYNEPEKMRQALVERGIPADRIVCDYAGLRTLDSVVRAKEIFGTDTVLFISQRFQNERAIYLAQANGIRAYGFSARDVNAQGGLKTKFREVGARVKMWLDVHFLHTRPKHLGDRETLPE